LVYLYSIYHILILLYKVESANEGGSSTTQPTSAPRTTPTPINTEEYNTFDVNHDEDDDGAEFYTFYEHDEF